MTLLDPSAPTIMHVGGGAWDTPRLLLLLGSLMHGAEHPLQASLACQYSPVHCGALHCDTVEGAVPAGQDAESTTRDDPDCGSVTTHCTDRVM
jgi:hypothetical protein